MADDHKTIADETLALAKDVAGGAAIGALGGMFLSEYAMLGAFVRPSRILLGGALFGAAAGPVLGALIRREERQRAIEESQCASLGGAGVIDKTWTEREAGKNAVNVLPPRSFS